MLTTNTHACYLARRHWPTHDPYPELSLALRVQTGRVSVKMTALDLEYMLVNRSIQTGRVASTILYNRDAVDLTLVRPV